MNHRPTDRRRHSRIAAMLAGLAMMPAGAAATNLPFPGPATATAERTSPLGSYALPIGPWGAAGLDSRRVEGLVEETAWRVEAPGITSLQLLAPLRDSLAADGFDILFECETRACGGFDFRYALRVLPEPDMHVDLGDFRFVSARRGAGPDAEYLALLVSRSSAAGFAQVVRVSTGQTAPPALSASTKAPFSLGGPELPPPRQTGTAVPEGVDSLAAALMAGPVPLDDLEFETGAATLGANGAGSLHVLAAYLAANPDHRVALVGHTDATGGLAGNVALSKRRAESVRDRLMRDHAVPAAQISAEGVGYLAPRDSNLTEEGRTRNRRVEVILTSTK